MALPYQRHQKQKKALALKNKNGTPYSSNSNYLVQLQNKPFWIWNKSEHLKLAQETNQQCCFNHIVGLPVKDGKQYPLFDYEKILYDSLLKESTNDNFKNKHLWIKKATGLGISEFFLD